jgi:hypothetical protein
VAVTSVAALAGREPVGRSQPPRFDEPVLFSTNDGLTLCGANLHRTWYGEGTGVWALDCAQFPAPPGDRSVLSNHLRSHAVDFIEGHLERLPVVAAVRVARVWSVYAPGFMVNYNKNEGRETWASWAGFVAFWVLVPVAGGGGLRRRRSDHAACRPVRDRDDHRRWLRTARFQVPGREHRRSLVGADRPGHRHAAPARAMEVSVL